MLQVSKKEMEVNKSIWYGNSYYKMAEEAIERQWQDLIWPRIKDFDFSNVVDLACGQGRNTQYLLPISKNITLIDIVEDNLKQCKERFGKDGISYVLGDGNSIPLKGSSISTVYCFDAMVHFEPEVVYNYIQEVKRVLIPGGKAFLHHSNYSGFLDDDWRYNPHARNFMTRELFCYWARKAELKIISSNVIDWGQEQRLDCITVLEN